MAAQRGPSGAATVFVILLIVGYVVFSVARIRGATLLKTPAASPSAQASGSSR